MRASEKTTQTVKKYTNFLRCFLLLFFTKFCISNMRRDKTQTNHVLGQNLSAAPQKASRVVDTHGDVVKTYKIDVLVTHVKHAKRK